MGETAHGCRGGSGLRVFVTGASGLIGAAAARALRRRGSRPARRVASCPAEFGELP
jgi:NAD(P)-dependent dehydrogenase (short-subunit alcohol dehydrogenase family)